MQELLDVPGVARTLKVSPGKIRQLIATKELFVVRVGRRVLVEPAEIERFIDTARKANGECEQR